MTFDLFDLALCPKCMGRGKIGMSIWKDGKPQLVSTTCNRCDGAGKTKDRLDDIQDRYVLNPDLETLAQYGADDIYWLVGQVLQHRHREKQWAKILLDTQKACKKCRNNPESLCTRCQQITQALGADPSTFGTAG